MDGTDEPQRRDGRARDTRQRIEAVALELFAAHGVGQTTLQDIADRLGLTKTALYYYFASKGELVRSVVESAVVDFTEFLNRAERDEPDARALLEEFFDLAYAHREVLRILINDPTAMAHLSHSHFVPRPGQELQRFLTGPDPSPEQRIRAFTAVNGLTRSASLITDVDYEELRKITVAVALETLTGGSSQA